MSLPPSRKRKRPATSWGKSSGQPQEKNPKSEAAFRALIRMLYKRDHSEKELRTKLNQWYTAEAVEAAMVKANDQKWLKDPSELAVIMGGWLHRRGKGLRTVNQTLKQKGLPPLARDADQELEKARTLLRKKFRSVVGKLDLKDRQKAYRMLASRGYDHDTISVVTREELGGEFDLGAGGSGDEMS